MRFVKLYSRLPLWYHYAIGDIILFPLLYHIIRYRRRLVRKNLNNAFPEKTWKEIKLLERDFYHFFCDSIAETIYGYSAPKDQITKRAKFNDLHLLEQAAQQYGGAIAMLGHVGNWEWIADYSNQLEDTTIQSYNVYRKLKNKFFDQLMIDIRRQRGGDELEKKIVFRHVINNKKQNIPSIYTLLSDQKPSFFALDYWTQFLNQDTPMLTGAETIAKKMKFPVLYVHIKRIKRGYYEATIEMIAEHPDEMKPYEITEIYTRKLEQNILENPALWLWTHNKWKFKR